MCMEIENLTFVERKPIIGFDFGDTTSYFCTIPFYNEESDCSPIRVYPLVPARWWLNGLPNIFFYSNNERCKMFAERLHMPLPWYGIDAVRMAAYPVENRISRLRRHLGESFTLDDKRFAYDDAIAKVMEQGVRLANKVLREKTCMTTNLVLLSCPVTFIVSQAERLRVLAERATLEDGTHIKVIGLIEEPAAVALDYLANKDNEQEEVTILTYDLGGECFESTLVSVYPKGRRNGAGKSYYYDVVDVRGIGNLGGSDFDEIMYQLLLNKIGKTLSEEQQQKVRNLAEDTKIELSEYEIAYPMLDDILEDDIEVTREEFEKASGDLIKKTVDATKKLLENHMRNKPDVILLTGGASQIPAIKLELEKALPQYVGKIQLFNPKEAVASGAARYAEMLMKEI